MQKVTAISVQGERFGKAFTLIELLVRKCHHRDSGARLLGKARKKGTRRRTTMTIL